MDRLSYPAEEASATKTPDDAREKVLQENRRRRDVPHAPRSSSWRTLSYPSPYPALLRPDCRDPTPIPSPLAESYPRGRTVRARSVGLFSRLYPGGQKETPRPSARRFCPSTAASVLPSERAVHWGKMTRHSDRMLFLL